MAKRSKKKKKKGIFGKIILVLLILLLIGVGYIAFKTYQNGWGLQGLLLTVTGNDKNDLENLEELQVLVLGISTDISAKLTDTIMVASYNPKNQKASLLSIPRDTYIGKNDTQISSYYKINAAIQQGPEHVLDVVNGITGLDLKYYVVVDTEAFGKLVDTIGGVTFDVPADLVYNDDSQDLYINLKKGVQLLDGKQAEHLVRYRKNNNGISAYSAEYGDGDYGRMHTQRDFMIAVMKQTIQAKNIFKVKELLDILYKYVETNLSLTTIKDYVPYAVNLDTSSVETAALPGDSARIPAETGLWFFKVDKKETEKLIEELYGDEEIEDENNENTNNTSSIPTTNVTKTEASKISIQLLDGSGNSTSLNKMKKALQNKGYNVKTTGTTTITAKTTIINKTDVEKQYTDNIREVLNNVGIVASSAVDTASVDITIIIGKDYK